VEAAPNRIRELLAARSLSPSDVERVARTTAAAFHAKFLGYMHGTQYDNQIVANVVAFLSEGGKPNGE